MIEKNQKHEPVDVDEEIDAMYAMEQRLLRAKKSLAQILRTMTEGDFNCARVYSASNDIDEALKAIQGVQK